MTDIDLGVLLGLAYQRFKDELHADLAAHGFADVGSAYGYVFRALAAEELSQHDLAVRLGISDQGMAKIVTEMVRRRYVERRADAADARVKRLRLSARGRRALAAARRFHAHFERRLVRNTNARSAATLRRLLHAMSASEESSDLAQARLRLL